MKSKTLIILYTIVAFLAIGVVVAKLGQNREEGATTKFVRGEKPLAKINPAEIAEIVIEDSETTTTVKIQSGKWVVVERGNYEAKTEALRDLIRQVLDLSVAQSMEAGPTFDPRFGMDESASLAESHGEVVTFKKKDGSLLTRIKFGKEIAAQGQQNPFGGGAQGRFVRFAEDEKSVYVVSDGLNSVDASPKNWLKEDFLKLGGITTLKMSSAGANETVDWELNRESASEEFSLVGLPEGEKLNAAVVNPMKNFLSYGNFEDVVTAKAAEGLLDSDKKRLVTVQTEDGFTYEISLFPKSAEGTKNYLMSYTVKGNFSEEFQPKEGSSEEAQKAEQEAFEKELKGFKERLATEKAQEGIFFELASWVVNPILKTREELFQKENAEVSSSTKTPYSVTTPTLPVKGR